MVETVDERDIADDTFSMGDTFEPISNAFDPLRDAVQPVTTAFNTPVIFGSGAAVKGGLATGLATAAGAPLVLVPAAAASAASKFFPQLNVPGLNNLGASIQDQLENFNLFNKATPEVVEDDQAVMIGETEDGQTILIPTPGNANAPTIVS